MITPRCTKPPKTPLDRGATIPPESRYLAGYTHIVPYIPHIGSKAAHTPNREYIKIPKILIHIGYNVSEMEFSVSYFLLYLGNHELFDTKCSGR